MHLTVRKYSIGFVHVAPRALYITDLWLKEVRCVATLNISDMKLLLLDLLESLAAHDCADSGWSQNYTSLMHTLSNWCMFSYHHLLH